MLLQEVRHDVVPTSAKENIPNWHLECQNCLNLGGVRVRGGGDRTRGRGNELLSNFWALKSKMEVLPNTDEIELSSGHTGEFKTHSEGVVQMVSEVAGKALME